MNRTQQAWLWTGIFTLLFLASLDYWRWGQSINFTWGHLPDWLLYFVGLQLAFAACIFLFIKYFWSTKPPDKP